MSIPYIDPDQSNPARKTLMCALVDNGSGLFTVEPVTGSRGTDNLVSLASGSGKAATVDVTPTVTAAIAYVAGNEVGGLLTFGNTLALAGSGLIQSITLKSKTVQTVGFKLYIFKANPVNTVWTDKTAPAINVADIANLVGVYPLSSGDSGLGTHTVYNLDGIGKTIAAGATTLYGILVTTGAPTFASTSDLTVSIGVLQD